MQQIVSLLASKSGESKQTITNRVNVWFDEQARFSISPFAAIPYAFKGGIMSSGDAIGAGKLQASEMKRVQSILPYVIDAISGATQTQTTLMLGRCAPMYRGSETNQPERGGQVGEGLQPMHMPR